MTDPLRPDPTRAAGDPTKRARWPEYLDLDQTRAYLNVSERMAQRLVYTRRVPVVKIGRHVRVPRAALDQLLAEGGIQ